MDVVLSVGWEIVVDDEGDLLDVDTTGQEVGGDQHATGPGSELAHNNISLLKIDSL